MSNLLARLNTRGRRRVAAASGFSLEVCTAPAAQTGTNVVTWTFTGASIGTAATGRRVLVAISATDNGITMNLTGVTIGGNAATIIAQSSVNTNAALTAFAVLQVDAGTTADIVVTFDADAAYSCAIQVYALYGLSSSTPADTATASGTTSTTPSGSLDCPAGGAIFGVVSWRDPGVTTTTTWDLTTEDLDTYVGGGQGHSASMAHQSYVAAQTALSVTATGNQAPLHHGLSLVSYG